MVFHKSMEHRKLVFRGVRDECWNCLENLLEKTVRFACKGNECEEEAREVAKRILDSKFGPGAIPAFIATAFQREIKRISGNRDPFLLLKREEMRIAKSLAKDLRPYFGTTLYDLFSFSVLGNALDFFRQPSELKEDAKRGIYFAINHIPIVEQLVSQRPGKVMLLADNSGEVYFDLPLLKCFAHQGWEAFYVVKGGSAQNDLTMDDIRWAGIHSQYVQIVSHSADTVGIDLNEVSEEFLQLFSEADLIIGKGMGHYETMSHLRLKNPVLFLLKAKCQPVASSLAVKKDEFVAYLE